MNEFDKRAAAYRAEQERLKLKDDSQELERRIFNLQVGNTKLFQEIQSLRRLNKVLSDRLSQYNEPPVIEEYTNEDLRMMKAMGIKP